MVTLYSKPACPACIGTERFLTKFNISFKKVDITQDEAARSKVIGLGYQSMPVVYADDNLHWSGLNMGKIKQLASALQPA